MRLYIIDLTAKWLGLLIHIDGMPYGVANSKFDESLSAKSCMPSDDCRPNASEVP